MHALFIRHTCYHALANKVVLKIHQASLLHQDMITLHGVRSQKVKVAKSQS